MKWTNARAALAASLCLMTGTGLAASASASTEEMEIAVSPSLARQAPVTAAYFHADWCPNCPAMQAIFEEAFESIDRSVAQPVVFDASTITPKHSVEARLAEQEANINAALDHNLVQAYNTYYGYTGLVVVTATETGQIMGCADRQFEPEQLAEILHQISDYVATTAPDERKADMSRCPRPMR